MAVRYREQIRYHVEKKGERGRPLRKDDFELANETEFDRLARDIQFLEEAIRIIHIDVGRAHAKIRRTNKILIALTASLAGGLGVILREVFLVLIRGWVK